MTGANSNTSSSDSSDESSLKSNSYDSIQYMVLPIKNDNANKDQFVGRDRFKSKLKQSILNALSQKKSGGSFLVGGYRGVGKTHLVNTVVDEVVQVGRLKAIYQSLYRKLKFCLKWLSVFKRDEKEFSLNKHRGTKNIHISLDIGVDSDLSTRDILCDLVEILYSRSVRSYQKFKACLLVILLCAFCTLSVDTVLQEKSFSILEFYQIDLSGLFQTYKAHFIFYFTCCALLYFTSLFYFKRVGTYHGMIEELTLASRYSREWDNSAEVNIPSPHTSFFQSRQKLSQEPISARRIQQSLINYIKKQREVGFSYIITFDEVDKINPSSSDSYTTNNKSRKHKVDELLGGLKALMNNSPCVFIVVAGREIVDAYYSESGYTSVLYESVFDDIFYIPTLLTDWSDGQSDCYSSMVRRYINTVVFGSETHSLDDLLNTPPKPSKDFKDLDKKAKQKLILDYLFYFEIFIKYLTLHSWGNFKRLKLMLNDHIEYYNSNMAARVSDCGMPQIITPTPDQKVLIFTPSDIRRMFVSARLYAMFDVNIGRSTSKTDDKAAVSGLITILDTFRFHSRGFSRAMIDRTIAGIDVHAESSLSYIADDYVHSTFQSMIRKTSNNIYPYRYYLSTDMEFSYFAKILGAKSSSFEFALDSAEPVREFYLREAKRQPPDDSANSYLASAKLQAILGDIFVCEHRYDLASSSYSNTIYLLKKVLRTDNEEAWRENGGISLEAQYMLIRSLMKKGRLEEERENTTKAISLYHEAQKTAQIIFEVNSNASSYKTTNKYIADDLSNFDSEDNTHHFLNQSIIAKLAINFANIKSGHFTKLESYQKHYCINNAESQFPNNNYVFLSKYLTTAYFSGMYSEFEDNKEAHGVTLKLIDDVLKEGVESPELKSSESPILYIRGQSQFSSLAKNLKELANIKDGDELAPTEFYRQWFLLVERMLKLTTNLSKASGENTPTLSVNSNYPLKEAELINIELLVNSFINIFKAADKSKKAGRYAEAAHQYTAILLNWIALLEIIPWRKLESHKESLKDHYKPFEEDDLNPLKKRPSWLDDVFQCAQDCVEKADKSSNIALRQSVLSRYTKLDISDSDQIHFNTNTFRAYDVLESLSKDDLCKDEKYSTMVWCRSNISNYLLIFGIWENYCRYSIGKWVSPNSKIPFNFHIIPVPIGNLPRVHALYRWLSARLDMHKLRHKMSVIHGLTNVLSFMAGRTITKIPLTHSYIPLSRNHLDYFRYLTQLKPWKPLKNSYQQLIIETHIALLQSQIIEHVANIVEQLSESLDDYKKAFRSDDPDSFPSKTHIYFNLAELIDFIKKNGGSNNYIEDAMDVLRERTKERAEKFTKEASNSSSYEDDTLLSMYLDKKYVELHLNKFRFDLLEIDNIQSLSYQRKLRHKYFLYDDFDDPFYIAEWAHLRMMSSSCRLLTIDENDSTEVPASPKTSVSRRNWSRG